MRHLVLGAILAGFLAAGPAFAQSITVVQPWTRAASAGGMTGAYMTLRNTGAAPASLTGADADVAGVVQLHRDVRDTGGTVRMQPRPGGVTIPAGGSVTLQPGAGHIMLMRLKTPLRAGATVPMTLHFDGAPDLAVTVPVAPAGATVAP